MEEIKKYVKLMKQHIKMISIFLFCILLSSGLLWGKNAISYIQGPKEFDDFESMMDDSEHTELDHAYVTAKIALITGSYAQYGVNEDTVYYLMPINNASAFITVIASGEDKEALDEMEFAFYDSIGNHENIYPETLQVEAGFKKLNEEEMKFALTYFKDYDEAIQTQEDIVQVMSPYALVVNEIGSMPVQEIAILLTIWIILLVIFLCSIAYLLYQLYIQKNKQSLN